MRHGTYDLDEVYADDFIDVFDRRYVDPPTFGQRPTPPPARPRFVEPPPRTDLPVEVRWDIEERRDGDQTCIVLATFADGITEKSYQMPEAWVEIERRGWFERHKREEA